MKVCSKCKIEKKESEFNKHKDCKNGLCPWCRECQQEYKRLYRLKNKEKLFKRNQEYYQRTKSETYKRKLGYRLMYGYGITESEFNVMLAKQNNCCAVCKKDKTVFNYRLAVDHDHVTGKVRGILCRKCNTAIGLLNEDKTTIQSAINYLFGTN